MKRPLLLGIDASRSTRPHPTGVERYSTEIIRALLPELKEFETRLYTPARIANFPARLQRVLWFPRFWSLVRLSWEMLWHKPDLLFVPSHVLPFFAPKRSFVTVHDVAFMKIPEAYGWKQRFYLRWSTRRAVKKCEKIFVPTMAVKVDVQKFFGARRVEVIPHGPLHFEARVRNRAPGKNPYFFYVGRLEEKKNLGLILDAWKNMQAQYPEARVILAGAPANAFAGLKRRVEQEKLRVELRGYVSEGELLSLYKGATAFLFPSLEEGFGFPILSAFEAQCPVICSDIPALKEVAGEAALYVGVGDSVALAKAMVRLLEDGQLRQKLTRAGAKRLKDFSWKKAAQSLRRVFASK